MQNLHVFVIVQLSVKKYDLHYRCHLPFLALCSEKKFICKLMCSICHDTYKHFTRRNFIDDVFLIRTYVRSTVSFVTCWAKTLAHPAFWKKIELTLETITATAFHTKRVEKCFCLLYILLHFSKTKCPMDMYYAPPWSPIFPVTCRPLWSRWTCLVCALASYPRFLWLV